MIDRRGFIAAAAVWGTLSPGAAAQPSAPRRIGYLSNGGPTTGASQLEAFRRGLRDAGWIEGQGVTLEIRWAEGDPQRLPRLVAELIGAKVDVIVLSGPPALRAARTLTSTIPIVFVVLVDPVPMGYAQSLARPGGNMTGLASQYDQLITKQLQLLKETLPALSRIALLRHSEASPSILTAVQAAAKSIGLAARTLTVASVAELDDAFQTAQRERVGAVHVLPSPYLGANRAPLIALAARYRLPAFYELRLYVEDGGLMSYGPNLNDLYGRSASYVDRILKGANPATMAIERPARFEFVINRRTAAALGLAIPPAVLQRADEVIG